MDVLPWVIAAAGAAALVAAILPGALRAAANLQPIVFLAGGVVAWLAIGDLPSPDPVGNGIFAEHLSELCVIVALMGAGLAIDRPMTVRGWRCTWRLLAITMSLTIGAVTVLGWWALGLGPAAAVLLGASLAPTDPVRIGRPGR